MSNKFKSCTKYNNIIFVGINEQIKLFCHLKNVCFLLYNSLKERAKNPLGSVLFLMSRWCISKQVFNNSLNKNDINFDPSYIANETHWSFCISVTGLVYTRYRKFTVPVQCVSCCSLISYVIKRACTLCLRFVNNPLTYLCYVSHWQLQILKWSTSNAFLPNIFIVDQYRKKTGHFLWFFVSDANIHFCFIWK